MKEGEAGVREAAGAEEGMVHGDVPVGCLEPGPGCDLGEPLLACREAGPRVGGMPWNGSRGGKGSRRTVRVAEVIEGETRNAVRETWPRAAYASRRAEDWAARSWVERGKVNRAR